MKIKIFSSKATSLTHYSKRVPSSHHERPDRTTLQIDLHSLKQDNPTCKANLILPHRYFCFCSQKIKSKL